VGSSGLLGGSGGGTVLAARLADPAAHAKTARDFARRGGLPTAVVAGEAEVLLGGGAGRAQGAGAQFRDLPVAAGAAAASADRSNPALGAAQRHARAQLAAEQAKEDVRRAAQLAAAQALVAQVGRCPCYLTLCLARAKAPPFLHSNLTR
jgi:hypothetical protein